METKIIEVNNKTIKKTEYEDWYEKLIGDYLSSRACFFSDDDSKLEKTENGEMLIINGKVTISY